MANLQEAFTQVPYNRNKAPEPPSNYVVYPINDMGHLELIDSNRKSVNNSHFHNIIGKDIEMNVDSTGFVKFTSKINQTRRTYNISGTSVVVDFSKLK